MYVYVCIYAYVCMHVYACLAHAYACSHSWSQFFFFFINNVATPANCNYLCTRSAPLSLTLLRSLSLSPLPLPAPVPVLVTVTLPLPPSLPILRPLPPSLPLLLPLPLFHSLQTHTRTLEQQLGAQTCISLLFSFSFSFALGRWVVGAASRQRGSVAAQSAATATARCKAFSKLPQSHVHLSFALSLALARSLAQQMQQHGCCALSKCSMAATRSLTLSAAHAARCLRSHCVIQ